MTKDWTSDGVVVADDGLIEVNACFTNECLFLTVIKDFDTLLKQASVATLTDKVRAFNDVLFEGKNSVSRQLLCSALLVMISIAFTLLFFILSIIPGLLF